VFLTVCISTLRNITVFEQYLEQLWVGLALGLAPDLADAGIQAKHHRLTLQNAFYETRFGAASIT
jgi:hypothetical protein